MERHWDRLIQWIIYPYTLHVPVRRGRRPEENWKADLMVGLMFMILTIGGGMAAYEKLWGMPTDWWGTVVSFPYMIFLWMVIQPALVVAFSIVNALGTLAGIMVELTFVRPIAWVMAHDRLNAALKFIALVCAIAGLPMVLMAS
jgi:hypothetical protein